MKKLIHRTVVDMAEEDDDYPIRDLLTGTEPEERPEKLAKFFLLASGKGRDEVALKFYKLLQQSLLDIETTPRVEETDGATVYTRDAMDTMRSRANSAIAKKTIELYPQIAGFKLNEFGKYIKDEERWGRGPSTSQLVETKKAMLEHVASQWRNTQSEAEATSCFLFLWAAYVCVFFGDEREICEKAIRVATQKGFPSTRLIQHYLMLTELNLVFSDHDRFYYREALGKILMHAWVNSIDPDDVADLFRAVQPVLEIEKDIFWPDSRKVAFEFLSYLSKHIQRFDGELKKLVKILQSEDGAKHIPGKIKIFYRDIRTADVLIEVEYDSSLCRGDKIQNKGHMLFELARDRTADWYKSHCSYKVRLQLNIIPAGIPQNPYFSRSQDIGE